MMNKTDMLQDIEKVLLSREELDARIRELGKTLSDEYRGKDLVCRNAHDRLVGVPGRPPFNA